ncbi:MAG: argininosuccinate lyase [Clostridia bacterium]|nr:argininosuccinate lyase [Clostridia bacterium]
MSGKLWNGRFSKTLDAQADSFNSSISFDSRMIAEDIKGSMAHAAMLGAKGIIEQSEADKIIEGLEGVLSDIEAGKLEIDMTAEDVHSFVEATLTERIGTAGKRLHTARSRNDQVALDLRLYLRDKIDNIISLLRELVGTVADRAAENRNTIMPGYTHLQRAQPITFAHHLLAYAMMLLRDIDRLADAKRRMNISPLGSAALAGTTYDIDREMTAKALGFDGISLNSLDGVSDRDYCVEIEAAIALVMMHLSRFSEEIILWSSWEFAFVELDDAYTTGSSIMPQKKNSDMAELVRGKTGRVYGDLMATLTTLKSLPLAYNKDMQEDKEAIFDSVDTVTACLGVFIPMIRTMRVKPENMYKAAGRGYINATDLADYLVRKGMAFREAYKLVGGIVAECIKRGIALDELPIEDYRSFSESFDVDLYEAISLETCVRKRISAGGTGERSVEKQLEYISEKLKNEEV